MLLCPDHPYIFKLSGMQEDTGKANSGNNSIALNFTRWFLFYSRDKTGHHHSSLYPSAVSVPLLLPDFSPLGFWLRYLQVGEVIFQQSLSIADILSSANKYEGNHSLESRGKERCIRKVKWKY